MSAYRGTPAGGHQTSRAGEQPAKLLLRVEETATALGISRTAVFRLLAAGELASLTIGHRRRIPRSAIDEFIAARLAEVDAASVG
jgi:excisionase family DNA binding protein